ncbi:HD-GYP domain-containing protein [Paraferrimonas sedimenticola]|uniref:Two-component system response regulator n=1 Tax=Paraferrimonas sedimenticola TaxID=375674 RepID=A0AA37RYH5_9GAMM|nr:two-component system response regulator [Paraferrimonas sedimenticola]GLP97259.1 two-component system response regulator [Paraferrimonas sedimenticola]
MVNKPTILIVDDAPDNIHILMNLLKDDYKVKAATSGAKALTLLNSGDNPDLILLDVIMPEMDGYQVCQEIKANPKTSDIPIIFVTANNQVEDEEAGFSLGAVDYLTKPVSPSIVRARVRTHLALHQQHQTLESMVLERTKELESTRLDIVRKLARAGEYKDNTTGMHIERIAWFARIVARKMNLSEKWCELLFHASPMHDIGKIGIPDRILLKPGKLDNEEWQEMKRHTEYGAQIIGDDGTPLLKMAREIALNHHEKWDGSGYPNGISGEEIPLSARIVAIVDVYDALTSQRPYKSSWDQQQTLELIQSESGRHFDPEIVDVFLGSITEIQKVQTELQ